MKTCNCSVTKPTLQSARSYAYFSKFLAPLWVTTESQEGYFIVGIIRWRKVQAQCHITLVIFYHSLGSLADLLQLGSVLGRIFVT